MTSLDLTCWLREQCQEYRFDLGGIFRRTSQEATWPLVVNGPEEFEHLLVERGQLLPLPKEPAALANVLEVSIVDFLVTRVETVAGAEVRRGTERGYPDLEVSGEAFGGGYYAIDVKAARRARGGRKTQSRITLYTGNTYFKWPKLPWPGCFRAFDDYAGHLDVIMIYTFVPGDRSRVSDLEIIVQEPWRIASKERSSTTREYIGAVDNLEALREGRGAFATPVEFYRYWRGFAFKVSPQVQRQLERALARKDAELAELQLAQPVKPTPVIAP